MLWLASGKTNVWLATVLGYGLDNFVWIRDTYEMQTRKEVWATQREINVYRYRTLAWPPNKAKLREYTWLCCPCFVRRAACCELIWCARFALSFDTERASMCDIPRRVSRTCRYHRSNTHSRATIHNTHWRQRLCDTRSYVVCRHVCALALLHDDDGGGVFTCVFFTWYVNKHHVVFAHRCDLHSVSNMLRFTAYGNM